MISSKYALEILRQFMQESGDRYGILKLGVFGSVARDEAKDDSDVDVVISLETPDPYFIVHIKEALEQRLGCHVDIVRLRDKMNSFLKQRIEREAFYV